LEQDKGRAFDFAFEFLTDKIKIRLAPQMETRRELQKVWCGSTRLPMSGPGATANPLAKTIYDGSGILR
jgi:hypothetical protein